MVEHLVSEYEQALKRFNTHHRGHEKIRQKLAELTGQARSGYQLLYEEHNQLNTLRYRKVYTMIEKDSLGVCSAEIVPDEFKTSHRRLGLTGPEGLGLFPIGSLRYLYFKRLGYVRGDHYENGHYYDIKHILRVCPHHFPGESLFQFLQPYGSSETVTEVTKREDGKFVNKINGALMEATYPQIPLSEEIFVYFGIQPLPAGPKRL